MARERDEANNGRDVSQDALARMAIRNAEMKVGRASVRARVTGAAVQQHVLILSLEIEASPTATRRRTGGKKKKKKLVDCFWRFSFP